MGSVTPLYRCRHAALLSSLILAASLSRLPVVPDIAGAHVAADEGGQCRSSSSITAHFNRTAIAAGDTLWLSSVLTRSDDEHREAVTVRFDQASVSYVVNRTTTTVPAPNGVVTFSPSVTAAGTNYDPGSNTWYTTVPSRLDGDVFLSGLPVPLPAGLPGDVHPVTWKGHFSADKPRVRVEWRWAAAAYTQFGSDYNALGVKPVRNSHASAYHNDDHAGTPESERTFVTGGATGSGGSNYTGSYSHTESIEPCRSSAPTATSSPTSTPTMSPTPVPPTATPTPASNCTTDSPPVCLTDFTAGATSVSLNTPVTLTASTNLDMAPTSDYIDIVDQSGTILASCGTGTSCTATVNSSSAVTNQYTAYLAQSCYPGCGIDARSASISVTWQ